MVQTGWTQSPGDIVTIGGGASDGALAINTNLNAPRGAFVDRDGNVYIADAGKHRIRKVTPDGHLTTIAGDGAGQFDGDDGPATQASLNLPSAVFVDSAGNAYIADTSNHRIRKVDSGGVIATIAGDGVSDSYGNGRFAGDTGLARTASLNRPRGVFVDSAGNVYIADTYNHRIRKVAPDGLITTVAGDGAAQFDGDDGPATEASLNYPTGVVVDSAGNVYIADTYNHRIRKVAPDGLITTVAGDGYRNSSGEGRFTGDGGPATQASLNYPAGVVIDSAGTLYIADTSNHRIRKVDSGGVIATVAGDGALGFDGDGGPATEASLNYPSGVTVDPSGGLYIADTSNHRMRKVDAGGVIASISGNGNSAFAGDGGPATTANLYAPSSVFLTGDGQIYIADTSNHRLRKIDTEGVITTVAGDGYLGDSNEGRFAGDGGPATQASLNFPSAVFIDGAGTIYIADTLNHRIRKITPGGLITTVAGDGYKNSFGEGRFTGDGGPATQASLNEPRGVSVDDDGNVYVADTVNHRIRKITPDGLIATVAGNGRDGFSGDGAAATQARLSLPTNAFIDRIGNLYIADTGNHRIRKVAPAGLIITVAGDGVENSSGEGRFAGDGSQATEASLNYPTNMVLDHTGTLYIMDTFNHRVRKIAPDGLITTVAGDGYNDGAGNGRFAGDNGPASAASLYYPRGLFVDQNRSLYIADTYNHRIRQVIGPGPGETEPITLTAFTALEDNGLVKIAWTTEQAVQAGFNVYRSLQPDAGFVKINQTTITGDTTSFQYLDRENLAADQTYYYRVEVIDLAGSVEQFGPVAVQIGKPLAFELFQNAPNPFNPDTVIRFGLPAPGRVTLRIYNLLGQEVVTLLDGAEKPAGFDAVRWNGLNARGEQAASGVYFYRLTTDTGFSQAKRMLLLR